MGTSQDLRQMFCPDRERCPLTSVNACYLRCEYLLSLVRESSAAVHADLPAVDASSGARTADRKLYQKGRSSERTNVR
jgi:hypothetical protein